MPNANSVLNGVAIITAVTPSSGSVFGGTVVTITGNGFYAIDNTQVKFGSSACKVINVAVNSLTCVTSAGTSGPATVAIKY